jgi:hypothetical protein
VGTCGMPTSFGIMLEPAFFEFQAPRPKRHAPRVQTDDLVAHDMRRCRGLVHLLTRACCLAATPSRGVFMAVGSEPREDGISGKRRP